MQRFLSTSIAAIFAASAAFAGSYTPAPVEPVVTAPVAAPAADWSGFYAGLQAGLSTGGEITPTAPPGPSSPFDATVYGGFVGYNTQFDSVVLGAEIGGQMGSGTLNVVPSVNFDVNYLIDARARLGYSFGSAMAYVAGGYSAAKVTTTSAPAVTLTPSGWTVGGGLELMLTDNLFAGAEYDYRSLSGTAFGTNYDMNVNTIQARIGYRF